MNRLGVHAPSFTNLQTVESNISLQTLEVERSHRLIVLIPPDSDCSGITRRLCKLAVETNSDIDLLGVCKDPSQEPALRRELVTVAALIRDTEVYVDIKLDIESSWVEAVKNIYQDGDMIVCIAEQTVGLRRRPLSQVLESTLKAPIYILSDAKPAAGLSTLLSQVIAWSGFLGIIAGFFLLQVKITQLPKDWSQTLLFILLLIPELGLIWVWNSIFS